MEKKTESATTKVVKHMPYHYLGKTGLQVSALGYGNWVSGDIITPEMEESTYQCMFKYISGRHRLDRAYENGVNYFDTAELYGHGNAETLMGKALKRLGWARKDFVLASKYFVVGPGVNDKMLSRKHILEGIDASLKRLQIDYLDVAFAHVYDYETPIEEVCRAFDRVVNSGKAFYWATSNWTAQQITEAFECCERHDLIKPVVEQPEYNLFVRKNVEVDLVPMYEKYGYGTTVWSPLAGGILSGKYNDGTDPPNSRYHGEKLTCNRSSRQC